MNKDEIRISKEALFNGSLPKSSTHAIEKCFLRNPDFIFVHRSNIFVWDEKTRRLAMEQVLARRLPAPAPNV